MRARLSRLCPWILRCCSWAASLLGAGRKQLDARRATLVSWALHNHWDTNFKASQGQAILQRYHLTSGARYDSAASTRFALDACLPPLLVRAPGAALGRRGTFIQPQPQGKCELHIKRAADGRGLIVHAMNLGSESVEQRLRFPDLEIASACLCDPIENDGADLPLSDSGFTLAVPGRSLACARLLIADV